MANKLFRPHRGGKSKMNSGSGATHVLEDGEFFVEYPDTGAGSGKCKVKVGNGVATYTELPYALGDTSTDPITFTEASSTTVEAALARVIPGALLQNIVGGLKRAVSLCNTRITTEVETLQENFQAGVDAVYDAVVAKGSTPASKSLDDVLAGIGEIETRTIHTKTYTFPANDTGGSKDLTADHEYRYVNATNVYNKGKADVHNSFATGGISYSVEEDRTGSTSYRVPSSAVRAYASCAFYNSFGYNNNTGKAYMYLNGSSILGGAGFWNGYVSGNSLFTVQIDNTGSVEGAINARIAVIYWTK